MSESEIPESWGIATTVEVADRKGGGTPSRKNKAYFNGTIPWITVADIPRNQSAIFDISASRECITRQAIEDSATHLIPPDSVIFSSRVSVGKVGISQVPLCTNQDFSSFTNCKIMPTFLANFLLSKQAYFLREAKGTTIKGISLPILEELSLPIPPLGEQHRIVTKIESTFKRIEAIEKAVESAESLLTKYRESLLNKAFRGELVPQDPKDEPASKLLERIRAERAKHQDAKKKKKDDLPPITEDEIPFEIPKSWEWVRLGDIVAFERGHNPPKSKFKYEPTKDYVRFIQIQDFKGDTKAVYVPKTPQLKLCKKGDIMMAAYRHVGNYSRSVEGAFNVALCKFLPRSHVSVDFVEALIPTRFIKGALLKVSERSMIPSMSVEVAALLLVPLPPSNEQARIVDALVKAKLKARFFSESVFSAKTSCLGQRASLLEAAFLGRLVPQDPSEGTGHQLLEQILSAKNSESTKAANAPAKKQRSAK